MLAALRASVATLLLVFPLASFADGMVALISSSEALPTPRSQRALFNRVNAVWELTIEPDFDGVLGGGAWIVPFSTKPEVLQADANLLGDLDKLTAPVFIQYCVKYSCCVPAAELDSASSESGVAVWEQGTVGLLEYVVVSAAEGVDLEVWLDAEGFVIPASVSAALPQFQSEGTYFFVAKLSSPDNGRAAIPPVTFRLPGVYHPVYPMRLTGLAAAASRLDLVIWIATPISVPFIPDVPWESVDTWKATTISDYDAALQALPSGTLALEFGGLLSDSDLKAGCVWVEAGESECFYGADHYGDVSWCPPIKDMLNSDVRVNRFRGHFDAAAMSHDITIVPDNDYDLPDISYHLTDSTHLAPNNVHRIQTFECQPPCDPCDWDRQPDERTDASGYDQGLAVSAEAVEGEASGEAVEASRSAGSSCASSPTSPKTAGTGVLMFAAWVLAALLRRARGYEPRPSSCAQQPSRSEASDGGRTPG